MQQGKSRPGRYAGAIATGLCGLAVLAAPAGAATVALVASTDPAGDVLEYAGELEEANDIRLTGQVGGFAQLADEAIIVPAAPCEPTNMMFEPVGAPRRFARCPWDSIVLIRIAGRNGIDRVRMDTELPTEVTGGEANDVLVGGPGPDELEGGPGGDELRGRMGRDRLEPGPGADIVEGGGGRDRVDYRNHDVAVSVDFDVVPDDGAPGEGDLVMGDVEDVLGTAFGDTLTGSADANRLEGRGGDDTLDGGAGEDELDGGAGADTIRADDGAADTVQCGTETDTVAADLLDAVDADCEVATRPAPPSPPPPTPDPPAPPAGPAPGPGPTPGGTPAPRTPAAPRDTTAPRAALRLAPRPSLTRLLRARSRLRVRCSETCRASARLEVTRRRARALGLRSRVVATGTAARAAREVVLTLRVTRQARRALARRRTLFVALRVRLIDGAGNARTVTQRLLLRSG